MFCTNCGIEVNEEGFFCSSYGSKIVINYKQQPPGANDEKELISYYFIQNNSFVFETAAQHGDAHPHIETAIAKLRFTDDSIQYNRGKLGANNI